MTPGGWLALGVGLFGAYLFILGWNVLAAALSYMQRMRFRRFPLGRCVAAAAGPSLLPVSLPMALAWWGCGSNVGVSVFVLFWGLSFWGSGELERRLPPSHAAVGGGDEASRDIPHSATAPQLTNAQTGPLLFFGTIKAWLALAVGFASGYGAGAAISWLAGLPFGPPSWTRLASRGPISVLVWYGILGFLVDCLRLQDGPSGRPGLAGWSAARKLRFRLLSCLAGLAACIGIYAGLWW